MNETQVEDIFQFTAGQLLDGPATDILQQHNPGASKGMPPDSSDNMKTRPCVGAKKAS